jgi:hypothetical protein
MREENISKSLSTYITTSFNLNSPLPVQLNYLHVED